MHISASSRTARPRFDRPTPDSNRPALSKLYRRAFWHSSCHVAYFMPPPGTETNRPALLSGKILYLVTFYEIFCSLSLNLIFEETLKTIVREKRPISKNSSKALAFQTSNLKILTLMFISFVLLLVDQVTMEMSG